MRKSPYVSEHDSFKRTMAKRLVETRRRKTWYVLYKDDGRAQYAFQHSRAAMKELKACQPYGDYWLDKQHTLPNSLRRNGNYQRSRQKVLWTDVKTVRQHRRARKRS